ncbi:hypothetical protein, partial [Acinetobacter schindleri]|uniref:hypothetical protein n=1 Tax=Acinetobacter schindleri TaxID=108981 RepID=UPI00289B099D
EHNLAKVGVASSSLVSRSRFKKALIENWGFFYFQLLARLKLDAWWNIYFSGYFHNPLLQLIY